MSSSTQTSHDLSWIDACAATARATCETFKDHEPGFLHMDIKYLPQMPDESQRRYLFVATDRATRWDNQAGLDM